MKHKHFLALALLPVLAGCIARPGNPLLPAVAACNPPALAMPAASNAPTYNTNPGPFCTAANTPALGASYGQFVLLDSIGCQNGGLATLRSVNDWYAYQTSQTCGVAVSGALDCFDFNNYTVISLQTLRCNVSCPGSNNMATSIVDVARYPDKIVVLLSTFSGGAQYVCPQPVQCSLVNGVMTCVPVVQPGVTECDTQVIAIPATNLPVETLVVYECRGM